MFRLPPGIERKRVAVTFTKPSRTKQQFKDEVDVNKILERYRRTGQLPVPVRTPSWGVDVSEPVDYQQAMNVVQAAQVHFGNLSAKIRARFDNDPGKFMAFMRDPSNMEEMVSLGLASAVVDPPVPSPADDKAPKS